MRPSKRLLLVFIPLMLLLALSLTAIAYASPPQDGSGTFTDTSITFTPVKQADGNTIVNVAIVTNLAGTLTGTAVGEFRCVVKSTGEGTCHGTETFTGTVCVDSDCRSGTLLFKDVIKLDGPVAEGQFTVVGGTGGLENLHGIGHFQGTPGVGGTYTTQFHFDPN